MRKIIQVCLSILLLSVVIWGTAHMLRPVEMPEIGQSPSGDSIPRRMWDFSLHLVGVDEEQEFTVLGQDMVEEEDDRFVIEAMAIQTYRQGHKGFLIQGQEGLVNLQAGSLYLQGPVQILEKDLIMHMEYLEWAAPSEPVRGGDTVYLEGPHMEARAREVELRPDLMGFVFKGETEMRIKREGNGDE